ncbi:DivIVA domain-containing protein [Psychromicrobium lacuslunae]|uniref:DivIVA domain-containing protein n=1 Tax=Psychromicrobium lacuslunae TaxID=1618207 RepID=UPI0009E5D414|nr:DivIVA domain-containing protein [Psychromicrobium lacuslunae]
MTYLLVFVAVLVVGATAFFLIGQRRRETGRAATSVDPANPSLGSAFLDDGLAAPVPNLPPVLLPEHPAPEDVDRVRFSLGLRGYRMDQVDQVLDQLAAELKVKEQHIAELNHQLQTPLETQGEQPVVAQTAEDGPHTETLAAQHRATETRQASEAALVSETALDSEVLLHTAPEETAPEETAAEERA